MIQIWRTITQHYVDISCNSLILYNIASRLWNLLWRKVKKCPNLFFTKKRRFEHHLLLDRLYTYSVFGNQTILRGMTACGFKICSTQIAFSPSFIWSRCNSLQNDTEPDFAINVHLNTDRYRSKLMRQLMKAQRPAFKPWSSSPSASLFSSQKLRNASLHYFVETIALEMV
jgi:hypothetical protein